MNKSLSTPVVLQPIPGCVCHRAVHSDWADGSNSDDGGHRWGRPCVPGTGSGRMTGKESLQHSQLWALPVGSKWGGFGRWWVGRKPTDRLGSPSGQTHLILQARGFTSTCQEERLAVAGRGGDFRPPLGRGGKPRALYRRGSCLLRSFKAHWGLSI